MNPRKALAPLLAALAALAVAAPLALAHQTVTSHGVAVTIHIAPDDEPVAGEPAEIVFVGARRRGWRLDRARCRCRLRISDSSGVVVLDRALRTRTTTFTFPRPGAYEVVVSGRVAKGAKRRAFKARFAYRAS